MDRYFLHQLCILLHPPIKSITDAYFRIHLFSDCYLFANTRINRGETYQFSEEKSSVAFSTNSKIVKL